MLRKTFTIAVLLAISADSRRARDHRDQNSEVPIIGGKRDSLPPVPGQSRGETISLSKIIEMTEIAGANENVTEKFVKWTNKMNKNYHNMDEYSERKRNWKHNNDYIREANEEADATGDPDAVRLGHGPCSDCSKKELEARFGLIEKDDDPARQSKLQELGEGKQLKGMDLNGGAVDWTSKTSAVVDQGACGSCWAFAANTVLEATINIRTSRGLKRLSAQFPVDCTKGTPQADSMMGGNIAQYHMFGCGGGWSETTFGFYKEYGTLREQNYPYISGKNGGKETKCKYKRSLAVSSVKEWGALNTPQTILDMLQERPLVVSVGISDQFHFYRSGIVKSESGMCGQNGHAMTIVGYHPGPDDNTDHNTNERTSWSCRQRNHWDNWYKSMCSWADEIYVNGVCCKWDTVNGGSLVPDSQGQDAYWKVQNSWGDSWGDNGFVKFAVEDGQGVCRFNNRALYVKSSFE